MLCVAFLKSGPGGAVKKEKLLLNASQNLKIFTIIGKKFGKLVECQKRCKWKLEIVLTSYSIHYSFGLSCIFYVLYIA